MMKLFVDSSEVREGSKFPEIEGISIEPQLEHFTGADFMLTPSDLPANSLGLLELHVKAGARLIQRKTGMDFIQSLGTRMNESLARMTSLGALPYQCILLIIGEFTHGVDGNAHLRHIGGVQNTNKPFWQVYGALMKWRERGGIVEMIPDTPDSVEQYLDLLVKHQEEFEEKPTKRIFPDKPYLHSAQMLEPINDARIMLATLPGIGEKTIEALLEKFDRPVDALVWLTMNGNKTSIKGIGRKTVENIREFLNLEEYEELSFEVDPEFTKPRMSLAVLANPDSNYEAVNFGLASIKESYRITEIVLTDSKGDVIPQAWANAQQVKTRVKQIKWNDFSHEKSIEATNKRGQKYNKRAAFIRNWELAEECDALLVIGLDLLDDRDAKTLHEEFMSKDKPTFHMPFEQFSINILETV